jgi:ABC-type branched-subunit amino acid transport system substrate-binding protein
MTSTRLPFFPFLRAMPATLGALAMCVSSMAVPTFAGDLPPKFVVGATLPLTGPGGAYGKMMLDGLKMGLDDAVAKGVVGSSVFELDVRDDQGQAGPAVSQVRDLLNSGVVAIVTAYTAPPLAQEPLAAHAKIPLFNGGGDDPSLLGKEYLWNDILTVDEAAMAGMRFLHDTLGVKKLAILFETDYTPNALVAFKAAWKSVSGNDAVTQSVDQAATTVGPQLEKLLAEKPDAIYLVIDGNIATLGFKELTQRSVTIPLMGTGGATVPEASSSPTLNIYFTTQSSTDTPEFDALAAKAGIDKVTFLHKNYFNVGQTIAQALKIASSQGLTPDGAGIDAVLKKSPSQAFKGCCGDFIYTASHGTASQATIYHIEDGKPAPKANINVQ